MSESSGKFLGMNKTEGIGTVAAIAGAAAFPQAVANTVHGTAGFVNKALEYTSEGLGEAGGAILGGLVAPVAGISAGVHVGNRGADLFGVAEDSPTRKWWKAAGGLAGLAASSTAALPYLAGGAIASKLGAKPFKWAAGKVGQAASAVVTGTIGTPISAIKSIPGNVKAGWNWGK